MNSIDIPLEMLNEQSTSVHCHIPFPSTEQLLVQGGDARIHINQSSGTNKYGCRPSPDSKTAQFGSATATSISEPSYLAAIQLRNRLSLSIPRYEAAEIYADEMNRIRNELSELCGLRNGSGVDIIFAASGTDVHLIAAQLVARCESVPVRMLMVDTAETGSGVTAALSGRHFANRAALGSSVAQGATIGNRDHGLVVAIPLRLADGTPRSSKDIDADFTMQVAEASAAGERVFLIMVDVSKTGLIAPSVDCVTQLLNRYQNTIDVMVDACQFRLSSATLQSYLSLGFMVGITGSKFVGGPSFSGALLMAAPLAKLFRQTAKLDSLTKYSSQGDWPIGWDASKCLDYAPNFGLLLRWECALKELRLFRSISNIVTIQFLSDFAKAVSQRFNVDPNFEALSVPVIKRFPKVNANNWDNVQTIFPFLVLGKNRLLSSEAMLQIYRSLQCNDNGNIHLAQPVDCGRRDGMAVSALRLCVSARMVVEAVQNNGKNYHSVINRALFALDKVSDLARETK